VNLRGGVRRRRGVRLMASSRVTPTVRYITFTVKVWPPLEWRNGLVVHVVVSDHFPDSSCRGGFELVDSIGHFGITSMLTTCDVYIGYHLGLCLRVSVGPFDLHA